MKVDGPLLLVLSSAVLLVGGCATLVYLVLSGEGNPVRRQYRRYVERLERHTTFLLLPYRGAQIARVQLIACICLLGLFAVTRNPLPPLLAFVAAGAILPRRSGIDPRPLSESEGAIPFVPPSDLTVELSTPHRGPVRGMGIPAGVTLIVGGGFHGNVPRILPRGVVARVDPLAWPRPGVFTWIQKAAELPEGEMLRVFNCGIGMILVSPPNQVSDVIQRLQSLGERAYDIGRVERMSSDELDGDASNGLVLDPGFLTEA